MADRVALTITLAMFFNGRDSREVARLFGIDPAVVADVQAARIDLLSAVELRDILAAVERGPTELSK